MRILCLNKKGERWLGDKVLIEIIWNVVSTVLSYTNIIWKNYDKISKTLIGIIKENLCFKYSYWIDTSEPF